MGVRKKNNHFKYSRANSRANSRAPVDNEFCSLFT